MRLLSKGGWLLVAGGTILLLLAAIPSQPEGTVDKPQKVAEEPKQPRLPADQQKFIEIVSDAAEKFRHAKNELQETVLRDDRSIELYRAFNSSHVRNWQGTIAKLETTSDGDAILTVMIADGVFLKTWGNSLSDYQDETLIPRNSEAFATLLNLHRGDKLVFSGAFITDDRGYFKEASVTIRGSVTEPEFIFRFDEIRKSTNSN